MPICLATAILNNIGTSEEVDTTVEEKLSAVQVILSLPVIEVQKHVPKIAVLNALRFMWDSSKDWGNANEAESKA